MAEWFGNSDMEMSCSYAQTASTSDLTYQVTTSTQNFEINQVTSWAALELKFFADETFAAGIEDYEMDIGTQVHMQVLWNQAFGANFPVEFYIAQCVVSDNDDNQFKVIDGGCGAELIETTVLSSAYSRNFIRYRYNSFSFKEDQNIAEQMVTCNINFCLKEDIESGLCGFEDC